MKILDRSRQSNRRPTLIEKIQEEIDLDILNGMKSACGARGQELTKDEIEAFARRRVELMKGV